MRATSPTTLYPVAPRCADDGVRSYGGRTWGMRTLGLSLSVLSLCVVFGFAGAARADSRGACVEVLDASAPTSAPLALDAERAAWVGGTLFFAHVEHGPGPYGRSANPAWCELGDEPQCDAGSPAPATSDSATSSDSGDTFRAMPASATTAHESSLQRPPVDVSGGAEGTHARLERPPQRH